MRLFVFQGYNDNYVALANNREQAIELIKLDSPFDVLPDDLYSITYQVYSEPAGVHLI